MVINRLGVQFLTGLRGNVGFVRDTADHAFVWTDEVTNTPNTSGTFGAFTMQPRTGQSATRFTRQLLRQAPESIENLIRNKVASIHARGVQRAALFGSGTGNEPRGIANTPGVNTVPAPGLGANGGAPTYDFMVDHETEIFVDDADVDGMGYVTSARVRGRLKKTQQFASTNGLAVWSGGVQGEVNGYAAYATNDVRTDRTKGSGVNLHEVYFGAWPKLMIGEWGVTEITVDELTEAPTRVKVMGYQLIDVGIETPSSFCYSAEAAP
jgi:HK97 family phage major capsid protein